MMMMIENYLFLIFCSGQDKRDEIFLRTTILTNKTYNNRCIDGVFLSIKEGFEKLTHVLPTI